MKFISLMKCIIVSLMNWWRRYNKLYNMSIGNVCRMRRWFNSFRMNMMSMKCLMMNMMSMRKWMKCNSKYGLWMMRSSKLYMRYMMKRNSDSFLFNGR